MHTILSTLIFVKWHLQMQAILLPVPARDVNEARSVRGRVHKVEAEAECYEAEARVD